MATRYFLNPDGSLRAEPDLERCQRFWQLYGRRQRLAEKIAVEVEEDRVRPLRAQYADELESAQAHMEVCTTCRAWLAVAEAPHGSAAPDRPRHPDRAGAGRLDRVQ